jgi:hypothetical protein
MLQEMMKPAGDKLILYRHETRRAVGMPGLDMVFQAGGVRDEGSLHKLVQFG